MDLLCTRESQTREALKGVPTTVALPKSIKRSRAHDDVVILTEKRARKGPGYYTRLADSAPSEQELAGKLLCAKSNRVHISVLGPHSLAPMPEAGPAFAFRGHLHGSTCIALPAGFL